MQRQKEAVALATAQNRILQQQCKFFFNFRPLFDESKIDSLTKIRFYGQNSIFFNFGPIFELGLKCVSLVKIRIFFNFGPKFSFFSNQISILSSKFEFGKKIGFGP